jgi:subtilisin family serine protease
MIRLFGRRRVAHLLTLAAVGAVGVAGTGSAAAAAPLGTVLQAGAAGAVSGSYIVVLKPGSAAAAQVTSASHALAKRYGGAVRRNYLTAVRGFSATMTSSAARRLAANPSVAYVEQDRVVRMSEVQNGTPWGLDRIDQRSLPLSSTYSYGSAAKVTAYVLDSGVRIGHAEFGGRAREGWDFIDSDSVANDCNGHGTHVAGTIGGSTYGVAKDVSIVGVRVLDCSGSGSYEQIIAGVDWVTTHAVKPAVVNMSLGGPGSTALDAAVKRSIAAGITYAAAAGNDNANACTQSPARIPAAITVGASDSADARASFSNHGSCLDIFGPGARIVSSSASSDTGAVIMSGTSMAAPHVAGAAALVLGASPSSTPAQVRDFLVNQATAGALANPGTGSPNLLLYTGGIAVPAPVVTPSPTPTTVPTTVAPTVAPTTVAPITVAPTTVAPTTVAPAPAAPTTSAPSTVAPTATPTVTPSSPPVTPAPCGPFVSGGNVMITDLATINSTRKVSGCTGKASSATSIRVQIKHSHRGSLVVTLIAPNGTAYPLKATATSDATDNLDATYLINASAAPRNGTWTLRVRDAYRSNIGYLDSWTLRL